MFSSLPAKLKTSCCTFLVILVCCPILAGAAITWEQLYPNYPTHGYNDIYVAGTSSAFAVGDHGLISYFDGSSWTVMTSPVNAHLNAIWGRSASDIFAVGDKGTIIHYNGSAWQTMSSPTFNNLHSVWGFANASDPVYAGGRTGDILKYAGGSWSFMETGLYEGPWDTVVINGIWGYSPGNLYAVGTGYWNGSEPPNEDIFLRCTDGSTWTAITNFPGPLFRPTAIWGFAGGLMYIAGGDGVYSLTDGAGTWTPVLADSNGITDIWGSSASDIWAVSDGIYHFDGGSWSTVISTVDPSNYWGGLNAVSGSSSTNAFAVGDAGRIFRYKWTPSGSAWSSMTAVPDYPINDLWRDSDTSLCAVGDTGVVLQSDGTHWEPMTSVTNEDLTSVCGWGNGRFIAVGTNGTVQFYNGTVWIELDSTTTEHLYDTWCYSTGSAYVVGANGKILNCTGLGCSAEATDGNTSDLYAVHNSDLGSYATGFNGVLMRKDGSTWNTVTPIIPVNNTFVDLWGDPVFGGLVAVGGSSIFSYNVSTNTWTQEYQYPATFYMQKVVGSSFATLLVAGYGDAYPYSGIILQRSGGTFQTLKNFSITYWPSTIQEGSSGKLYVGGTQKEQNSQWHGQILHFDGSVWSNMIETSGLTDIWGGGLDSVFAVGYWGTILHYDGISVTSMESNTLEYLTAVYAGDNGNWATATGGAGKMFYFDGSTWAGGTNGSTDWMDDLWGVGDTVYAVGYGFDGFATYGSVLRSLDRGASWNTMSIPATDMLNAVWGASASGPIFAVGDNGTVLTFDGSSWADTPNSALSYIDLNGVWGSSASDVYAVGDYPSFLGANESQIIHFDGSSWTESYYSYNTQSPKYLTGIWGSSDKDVIAFGTPNLRRQCGRSWQEMNENGIPSLSKGWGKEDPDGNYHIFGITAYNSVYHYTIPAGLDCSFPWTLFLPVILSQAR